jgi:hypothetical protein
VGFSSLLSFQSTPYRQKEKDRDQQGWSPACSMEAWKDRFLLNEVKSGGVQESGGHWGGGEERVLAEVRLTSLGEDQWGPGYS